MSVLVVYGDCDLTRPCIIFDNLLKGTKRQYSGQLSQIFKNVKTIEIQPVRQSEVCGKV